MWNRNMQQLGTDQLIDNITIKKSFLISSFYTSDVGV